ncbi:MAG TPA: glutamine--fructose-6-phosphate transaminase (isomerizing) [Chromatiales bacterium]|nr:glutamine--fructose-6-phosphate transaminase (isomerizing) [Thiotrichales bacterium]HIP69687.1 glutamine--fructose-6-phosphate transaminase (isomerizing) [Chromatiales bacterium]
MCGIVGGVAQRDVAPILLEGLKRLEYRGYDSAGMAAINGTGCIARHRKVGKVVELEKAMQAEPLPGGIGIAHTRWATHGVPSENNAHPHICNEMIAVVHNGIIENFEELREEQTRAGFRFTSETDTEVIVHQVARYYEKSGDLLKAVEQARNDLKGAYALGVIAKDKPEEMITARQGSPLVIGLGIGENFIASDVQALLPVTQRFIYLENGDIARISRDGLEILDKDLTPVEREVRTSVQSVNAIERGEFKHYMLKEIYEQPAAVSETLQGRITETDISERIFGAAAGDIFDQVKRVQIVACGTSYHAGLVAKYWFESLAGIRCDIEVASEFRYRPRVVEDNTLFVTISQSGETADTLAALHQSKQENFLGSLCICNVPESSLVRDSDLSLMTHAGPEIGVASTKAFTTQLVALLLLVIAIGKRKKLSAEQIKEIIVALKQLPTRIETALRQDDEIQQLSNDFIDKHHALFLGRGVEYPIAMEGALKLKEISYIHAEAYPAGELKHGPLALVDEDMPVVTVAPNNDLLEKLRSNLEEVRARGGKLYVFATRESGMEKSEGVEVVEMEDVPDVIAPIVNVVYLQLLSYHVAVLKGTDVDQPRNLAKSVTVE